MMSQATTLDWLQSDLKTVHDILACLTSAPGDFRSKEELRGGVAGAKDKVSELRKKVGTLDPASR